MVSSDSRQKTSHLEEDLPGEESFLPDEEEDDDSINPKLRALMQRYVSVHICFSANIRRRLEKDRAHANNDSEEPTCTKIYYASRTHSQLAQVIHELRKLRLTKFTTELHDEDEATLNIRTVSLASRKQLCVNEKLQKSGGDLDEKCRDMLSSEKSDGHILPQNSNFFKTKATRGVPICLPWMMRFGCLIFGTRYW